jgi:predicted MFS family arabinose efflux permease
MVVLGIAHLAAGLLLATHISRLQVERSERGGGWTASARTAGAIVARSWARVVLAGAFLEGATMFGAFAYVGADLHERFGIGLGLIGTTIAVFGAGALCYALSAGVLLRQLAQARLLALSSALLATGYLILAFMSHFWLAAPAVALLGMGFYMLHNNLQTEATQMAPEARGLSVSLFAIMLFTGQSAGVALAGVVVDRWGAKPVFLTAAVGLALIALWFRRRLLAHHRSLHSLG